VFAIATNQALFHIYQTAPGGLWSGWGSLGGAVLQIAAAANGDGRIEVFAIATNQALFHIWQATPTIQITNLTHPGISPNFEVGDTFQIRVWGPPSQPVYRSEAWNGNSSTVQIGTTDATGHFQIAGTETASQTGTYTDVYSVGSTQAMPTVSYVVAQLSGTGWVASGERAQTPDGHVSGLSYLSISNGSSIWTSSTTYLDYAASAYYDTQTVATLYQDGQAIQQGIATGSSSASGSLSATAIPWNDYTLQTDHYVVAFFPIGFDFYNPFYLGDGSCVYASSDCSIGIGSGPILVIAASIYLGSTLADQSAVPLDGTLPTFDTSAYDSFLQSTQPPYPSGAVFKAQIVEWAKRIATVYTVIRLAEALGNPSKSTDYPIPFYVDLVEDVFDMGKGERQRTFIIKDINGNPWNMARPLRVRERFSNISTCCGGTAPDPDGVWSNKLSFISSKEVLIENSSFTDHHRGNPLNPGAQVNYLQYYYATDFTLAPWQMPQSILFSVPGVSTFGPTLPLWIRDRLNKCIQISAIAAEGISFSGPHIYIDGDNGPGTGCRF